MIPELLTVAYHEREQAPVIREVEAAKVDNSGRLWLAQPGRRFEVWEEFTPIWRSYTRLWLVVDFKGQDVVCADDEQILFPGNEQGFQMCVQLRAGALYPYQRRSRELAHFHDGAPWIWNKEEGSGLWHGGIDALTIAPASYFEHRYDLNPQEILRPRERPSALAERVL
jgi:hypothetical protein